MPNKLVKSASVSVAAAGGPAALPSLIGRAGVAMNDCSTLGCPP